MPRLTGYAVIATTICNNFLTLSTVHCPGDPNQIADLIYIGCGSVQDELPCGETNHAAGRSTCRTSFKIMGDKSPKSNQKKSTQKQSKASASDQKKKLAVTAKQSASKKN